MPGSAFNLANPTMSLVNTSNVLSNGYYTHSLSYPANFNINKSIILKIGNISADVFTTSQAQGSFRIQANTTFGNTIFVNTASNVGNVINTSNITLEYLDISLVDLDNNLINLNNADWTFSLGISYLA